MALSDTTNHKRSRREGSDGRSNSVSKRRKSAEVDVLKSLDNNQKVNIKSKNKIGKANYSRPTSRQQIKSRKVLGELDITQFRGQLSVPGNDGSYHIQTLTDQWDNSTSESSTGISTTTSNLIKLPSYVTPPRNNGLMNNLYFMNNDRSFDIFEDPEQTDNEIYSVDDFYHDDKENSATKISA